MKALILFLLVALSPTLAYTQYRSDAEATYALKGPVRSFKTEVATFVLKDGNFVEGPRVVQMEASFNTDGNRTDLYIYNDKGILVRRIVMKFEGRNMVEAVNYDGAGKAWLRSVNAYDNEGRMTEEATYQGDGSLRSKTIFKRNARGQLVEKSEYSAEGVLLEQFTYKYEGDKRHSAERKIFRPDGSLQALEIQTAPSKRETTFYNPDGTVATKSVRVDQEVQQYNQDGSLAKITTISDQGRLLDELTINPRHPKRESEIPDQTDAHGNWTKQTKWSTDANGTKPLKATYRTITYYQN
ncbi:MAG TPA: hypothetical protein VFR78_06065 [Pyrinomonadaceae bacterium]|nr:hypothetical protein [Pyrinomonadaceae bacterium]